MKSFKDNVEIRLEQGDLIEMIEDSLRNTVFSYGFKTGRVASVSLHPGNKYVVRITLAKNADKQVLGYFRKIGGALIPDDDATVDQLKKLKAGDVVLVDYKRPRNVKFHRKFQALVNLVYDNQDKYTNREALLTELKLQVGHYEEHITLGGKVIFRPKSIAFASMDEDEFSTFYSSVVDVVLRHFLTGMDEDELHGMIDSVLGFI